MYIYEHANWPHFTWDNNVLLNLLGEVRLLEGRLLGSMASLGFDLQNEAVLETLCLEVVKTSEIEGEVLNKKQVRSSVARRLGIDVSGVQSQDRNVEGVVDMMYDATQHFEEALTTQRLFDWHCALFPTGRSGMYKILTGAWRDDSRGPMQIVSGAVGREKVHYQAPAAADVPQEMAVFIEWFNTGHDIDPVLKAGIAHLWFVTIHPFEDGNGRIARALTEMLLARADGIPRRFYSMSSRIQQERKKYYSILEKSQRGTPEISPWLSWFLNCLKNAITASETTTAKVLSKNKFWNKHSALVLNARQILMLNKLLNGFKGKLTTTKWAKTAKCSSDTALRDIQDLITKRILRKQAGGGRSTGYELMEIGD